MGVGSITRRATTPLRVSLVNEVINACETKHRPVAAIKNSYAFNTSQYSVAGLPPRMRDKYKQTTTSRSTIEVGDET